MLCHALTFCCLLSPGSPCRPSLPPHSHPHTTPDASAKPAPACSPDPAPSPVNQPPRRSVLLCIAAKKPKPQPSEMRRNSDKRVSHLAESAVDPLAVLGALASREDLSRAQMSFGCSSVLPDKVPLLPKRRLCRACCRVQRQPGGGCPERGLCRPWVRVALRTSGIQRTPTPQGQQEQRGTA